MLTVGVTQNASPPQLKKGEYHGTITITSGSVTRTVGVVLQIFPQITIFVSPPTVNFPGAGNSYAPRVVTATTLDSSGLTQIQATATVDPASPEKNAVSVTPPSVNKSNTNSADFSVAVNPALLGPGDHSIVLTFENQANREQVFLNVAVSIPVPPPPVNPVVSGVILDSTGKALPGVLVTFTGGISAFTTASGAYSATLPPNYTGTATPSAPGYTFLPPNRIYSNLTVNRSSDDYTAFPQTSVTVEGNVRTSSGQVIVGALIEFSGGIKVYSDASGHYSASVGAGFTGSSVVSLDGYAFFPPGYVFNQLAASVSGFDFVGARVSYILSGYVRTAQGQPVAGVRLDFAGGPSATTDSAGYYLVRVPVGYTGLATLTLAGYSFSPPGRSYNTVTTDLLSENYTATQTSASVRISGAIRDSQGTPVQGAAVLFTGGASAQTDSNGAYSVSVDSGYSGTATPSLDGYSFSPATRTYSNQGTDLLFQDYTAAAVGANSTVSGTVRDQSGRPLANVTLVFSAGPTLVTGADGTYLATLNRGYSGTVTVSSPGYRLEPATRSYSLPPPSLAGEDYTARLQSNPAAEILSPPPGSTLGSGTVTFQWMVSSCASQFYLAIGSRPAGSDLYNSDPGGSGSVTVSGLPQDGRTLYVRFFSRVRGDFRYNDYVFTAADASRPPAAAQMIAPSPGSLGSSNVPFRWTAGAGVSQYYLAIGRQPGGNDLLNQDQATAQTVMISGLPADGSRIYVRLLSRIGADWQSNDYVYTMPGGPEAGKAELQNPPNFSTLCSSSATFQWTPGTGAAQYFMAIGSASAGNDLFNLDLGTGLSRTIDGLPADGRPLYIRLFSLIGSTWYYNDYLYAAASQ